MGWGVALGGIAEREWQAPGKLGLPSPSSCEWWLRQLTAAASPERGLGDWSQDLLPGCLETDPPQGQTGCRGPAPCQWVGLTLEHFLLWGIPDHLAELPCPTLSPKLSC